MMKFGRKKLVFWLVLAGVFLGLRCEAQKPKKGAVVTVPLQADAAAKDQAFRDGKFGVTFTVPAGWQVARKDGEVSTFHLDARSAPRTGELRGVATLGFNPYPQTTLSGALFYYSVERKSTDDECSKQAAGRMGGPKSHVDDVDIGGMNFKHGHDQQGGICVEQRDEIYTAYRKGACYRFDLALNTFCAVSSGASDLADSQMHDIEARLAGILSTVKLEWETTGATVVPVPAQPKTQDKTPDASQPVKVGVGS